MTENGERVAVVTGAGDAVGTAVPSALAQLRYTVAAVDRWVSLCSRTMDELTALGRRGSAFSADLTLLHEAEATVGRIREELGPPAVLVNNPQFVWSGPSFPSSPEEDWDTLLRINLRAAFLMSRAAQQHLVQHGSGRIVNIASTVPPDAGMRTAVATARAGLHGFSRALAAELGPFGVTVNTVIPGYLETRAARAVFERRAGRLQAHQKDAALEKPVGRASSPKDVAQAVCWFLSDSAEAVSGQIMALAADRLD